MNRKLTLRMVLFYLNLPAIFILMVLTCSSEVRAKSVDQNFTQATGIHIAHYYHHHPHRYYPHPYPYWQHGPRFYPRAVYWTGWHRISRHCMKKCLINRWGRVIRCVRRCH